MNRSRPTCCRNTVFLDLMCQKENFVTKTFLSKDGFKLGFYIGGLETHLKILLSPLTNL